MSVFFLLISLYCVYDGGGGDIILGKKVKNQVITMNYFDFKYIRTLNWFTKGIRSIT